jgi:hypothetical protein
MDARIRTRYGSYPLNAELVSLGLELCCVAVCKCRIQNHVFSSSLLSSSVCSPIKTMGKRVPYENGRMQCAPRVGEWQGMLPFASCGPHE